MLRQSRQTSDTNEFNSNFNAKSLDLRVSAVGIIQSYNPANSTAEIQLTSKEGIINEEGKVESVELPILPDVPIVFPHSKEHAITFPIKEGDECLVIFNDRAIDAWWQSGGVQEQNISRFHSLSDAIAIVGPYSQNTKLGTNSSSAPHSDNLQVRSFDGKTYIELQSESNNYNISIINNNGGDMTVDMVGGAISVHASKDITIQSDANIYLKASGEILLNGSHVGIND